MPLVPSLAYPLDPSKTAIYYVHHFAYLACFLPIIFFKRLHFYTCWSALVELTNPFVGACQNIERLGLDAGERWGNVQLVTGGLLLLLWIPVRLIGIPIVAFTFLRDAGVYFRGHDGPPFERVLGSACMVALTVRYTGRTRAIPISCGHSPYLRPRHQPP